MQHGVELAGDVEVSGHILAQEAEAPVPEGGAEVLETASEQVVDPQDVMAVRQESVHEVAADEPRRARDQYSHDTRAQS